jgi:hypothetical protein
MGKVTWTIDRPPKISTEIKFTVKISHIVKFRYWIAKQLLTLAAWVVNSDIDFLEAK